MARAEQKQTKMIPAKFVILSSCEDKKRTSDDTFNVKQFQLPNPVGKLRGTYTSTLLSVLSESQILTELQGHPISWIQFLRRMKSKLQSKGFTQSLQLSASQLIDVNEPFEIVPPITKQTGGTRRAILIGINYTGQLGQLSYCHTNVKKTKNYLTRHEGFEERDMLILMDDGRHPPPTRRNIEDAFQRIVQCSKANDTIFLHYSGYGGRNTTGYECSGNHSTLIPVDFKRAGQIRDEDIFKMLVLPMSESVNVTGMIDFCHGGTALSLPYSIKPTDTKMHRNNSSDDPVLLCCATIRKFFSGLNFCDVGKNAKRKPYNIEKCDTSLEDNDSNYKTL